MVPFSPYLLDHHSDRHPRSSIWLDHDVWHDEGLLYFQKKMVLFVLWIGVISSCWQAFLWILNLVAVVAVAVVNDHRMLYQQGWKKKKMQQLQVSMMVVVWRKPLSFLTGVDASC